MAILLRLSVEQFFADRRDYLNIDTGFFKARYLPHQIHRRAGACAITYPCRGPGAKSRITYNPLAAAFRSLSRTDFCRPRGNPGRATSIEMMPTLGRVRQFPPPQNTPPHIVVIPEVQVNRLAPGKQLPHLSSEDAEVRPSVGSRLRPRMSRQNVQHAMRNLLSWLCWLHTRAGVYISGVKAP